MKSFVAFIALISAVSCSPSVQERAGTRAKTIDMSDIYEFCPAGHGQPRAVSLDALVKDPSAFEDQLVETKGYYYSYFEHSAVYPTPENRHYQHDFSTGLWVLAPLDASSNQLLRLTGTITTKSKGHLGQWPGSICLTRLPEPITNVP